MDSASTGIEIEISIFSIHFRCTVYIVLYIHVLGLSVSNISRNQSLSQVVKR